MKTLVLWLNRLFGSVGNREKAIRRLDGVSYTCYILAGLGVLMAVVMNPWMLVDALTCAALGIWLHLRLSRLAAVLLLIYGVTNLVFSTYSHARGLIGGVILTYLGARACQAVFKLQSELPPTDVDDVIQELTEPKAEPEKIET